MTEREAAALVAFATTTMPNMQEKSLVPTAKAWAAIMPELDFKTAQAALIKIMRTKKYATLPLPAEILEAAKELQHQNTQTPDAIEAWQEVRKKADIYKAPEWSHPAISQAVKSIGLRNICASEYDMSKRFMERYDLIVKRQQSQSENKLALQIAVTGKLGQIGKIALVGGNA